MTKEFIEKVLREESYETRKYVYRIRYRYDYNKDQVIVRIQRMPSKYIGYTAMLDPCSWKTVAEVVLD